MPPRIRTPLPLIALTLLFGGCAAQAPRPAPAATPAQPPAQSEQPEAQTVAPTPAAPGAGQAAPGSANREYRAEEGPNSLSDGDKKTKAPEFSSVSDAEAALLRANQRLVVLYAPAKAAQMAGGAASSGTKPTLRTSTAAADEESRCDTACKAFASLKRAADAVCRLAGDDDARCDHAKKLVNENGRRVAQCGCRDGG